MKAWSRRRRGEEGSALLIALFFATTFSLLVASILSFSEAGLRASNGIKAKANTSYAADGAVNAAISNYGGGGACNDYAAPLGPGGQPVDGQSVIVRCDANGAAGVTKPGNTLLSLGSEGTRTTTGMRVFGNVYSNSTVTAAGTLLVQGKVSAVGTCTGPIQTAPPVALQCAGQPAPAAAAPAVQDPDYAKATTVVPPLRVVPPCPAQPVKLVKLEPGYYDDAASLSALTNGGCAGATVWLQPGNYYLDFSFRSGADATWTVNDATVSVVGGTPKGWDTTAPILPTVFPGSCRTDTDAAPNAGVQVIMGGQSHLAVNAGKVELCAQPSTTDQEIAVYGLGPDRPSHTLAPTALGAVTGFANPRNAEVINELPVATAHATAALGPASTSASLALTSFRRPVPAGSVVDKVTLRVAHQDDGQMGPPRVTITGTGDTCGPHDLPLRPGTLVEDTVDLTACGLASPAALAAMTVTYDAALSGGGTSATATLDGIALDVAYREPVTRKPTTVIGATGFTNPNNALEIGEQPVATADAALASGGPTSASITVSGLGDPPIPPGSTIDSAVLRVAHRDLGDIGTPAVTVVFGDLTSCTGQPLAIHNTMADDRFNLACGLTKPSQLVGLTATYVVGLASGGIAATDQLDGMSLELVYRAPALSQPATAVTPTVFTGQDNAKVIGEQPTPQTADATLAGTGPTSASLAFSGFGLTAPVPPAGSFVNSAVLRIAHQDVGDMGPITVTVAGPVTPNPCTATYAPISGSLFEDQLDLKAVCGLTTTDQLTGLTVTYSAALNPGGVAGTDHVDGVAIDVAYSPPSVRAPSTTSAVGFDSSDNAKVFGEQPTPLTADAPFVPGGLTTASLTVNGFNPGNGLIPVPLPPGSVIDSASLRVAHQDDAGVGPVTVLPQFTGATCTAPLTLPLHATAMAQDRVDLMAACGLGAKDQDKLTGLSAVYNAALRTSNASIPAATTTPTGFATAENAKAIDGATADASLDATGGPTSASIVLDGYDQTALPAGAVISSAKLRIAHQDDGTIDPVTVHVAWTGGTGGPGGTCDTTFPAHPGTVKEEDPLDLRGALCSPTNATDFTGLTVTYGAALTGGAGSGTDKLDGIVLDLAYQAPATDRVDGVALDVVYRAPAFEPLAGNLLLPGYTGGPPCPGAPDTPCALVKVTPAAGDTTTRFVVDGTVYAPTAPVDIAMNGVKSQVLTRGVVARAIRLGIKPDPAYQRPTVGVPPETLLFTAYPDVKHKAATAVSTQFVHCSVAPPGGCVDNARTIDGVTVDADLAAAPGNPSAALTLAGWDTAALPSGSGIDTVMLRVAHREEGDVGQVTITAKIGATVCADQTLPLDGTAAIAEDQVDLKGCGLSTPAQLASLTITYGVDLLPVGTTATDHLDGMTLDLLAGPLLRASVTFNGSAATVQGWSTLP